MNEELMFECFFNNSNSINKQSKDNKYVKITYISEPIGKEKIRLQLTTFDVEAFEKDKNLTEIPLKTVEQNITLPHNLFDTQECLNSFEELLNNKIDEFYKQEIKILKNLLERYC